MMDAPLTPQRSGTKQLDEQILATPALMPHLLSAPHAPLSFAHQMRRLIKARSKSSVPDGALFERAAVSRFTEPKLNGPRNGAPDGE